MLKPENMKGRVEITRVEIAPKPNERIRTPAQRAELTVRNVAPVVLDVDGRAIRVRSLVLAGQGTQLEAAGSFAYQGKTPWDLRVNGTLNLAALRTFNSDILASGSSSVEATVRGSAEKPVLNGRLELRNASLYVEDLPNGVDNANGVMYSHGFATVFLGEVYGMTGDEEVKEKLQRAVRLIHKTQNKEGGWRYNPVPFDADISVTICQVMGLRAARDGANVVIAAAGGSSDLTPLGENRFRINARRGEVSFESRKPGSSERLILALEGSPPITYEAVSSAAPTVEQLAEYSGAYYSDEIDSIYRVAVKEGKLTLLRKKFPPIPLQPAFTDAFTTGSLLGTIKFTRDSQQHVTGLIAGGGRIRNLRFEKQPH